MSEKPRLLGVPHLGPPSEDDLAYRRNLARVLRNPDGSEATAKLAMALAEDGCTAAFNPPAPVPEKEKTDA